jgi:hypothetical protein
MVSMRAALAQSAEYSCPHFPHIHQAIDCLEALFSEDLPDVHGHFMASQGTRSGIR